MVNLGAYIYILLYAYIQSDSTIKFNSTARIKFDDSIQSNSFIPTTSCRWVRATKRAVRGQEIQRIELKRRIECTRPIELELSN